MTPHGLLEELVLVYALAIVLLLDRRAAACAIDRGPHRRRGDRRPGGVGVVTSQEDVDLLSEIGVALLLFTAGLEFSLNELRRMWRTIVPGGLAQVALTAAVTGGVVAIWRRVRSRGSRSSACSSRSRARPSC